ncbi:hypothetical protein [Nonomuraea helvata]|uniref:Uncharacterized protein n=1 Tax=Nonomuraea helvata TaxID=37484 RepID=A0ABV5RXZ7_9ACTN
MSRQLAKVATAVEGRPLVCRISDPGDSDEAAESASADANPAGDSSSVVRWSTRESTSWWKGLRTALSILEVVAALKHDEALVAATRALIAVGDMIVGFGEQKRS